MIVPMLRLIGVDQGEMSPFCKIFETTKELHRAYVSYCPKTFSYKGQSGEMEGNAGTDGAEADGSQGERSEERRYDFQNPRIRQRSPVGLSGQ